MTNLSSVTVSHKIPPSKFCNETKLIDVQYTRALYSLSNRLRLACKIREQTYIAVDNVAVFPSFLFADFILNSIAVFPTKNAVSPFPVALFIKLSCPFLLGCLLTLHYMSPRGPHPYNRVHSGRKWVFLSSLLQTEAQKRREKFSIAAD